MWSIENTHVEEHQKNGYHDCEHCCKKSLICNEKFVTLGQWQIWIKGNNTGCTWQKWCCMVAQTGMFFDNRFFSLKTHLTQSCDSCMNSLIINHQEIMKYACRFLLVTVTCSVKSSLNAEIQDVCWAETYYWHQEIQVTANPSERALECKKFAEC